MAQKGGEVSLFANGGGWERGKLLAEGGFGSVYLATPKKSSFHSLNGLPPVMAVKTVEFARSGDLNREKDFLIALEHCPQIIKCYGEDITTSKAYGLTYNILLEYAIGGCLIELMEEWGEDGLPEDTVRCLTLPILLGINNMHKKGIIHCDLKPDNILLVQPNPGSLYADLCPKICDFGAAKWETETGSKIRGTSVYMSPEALFDRIQEAPSDIWAFGCTVFTMFTGNFAWELEPDWTFDDVRLNIRSASLKIPEWISEEAQDFLKRCFVRDPKKRWSAEMLLKHPFLTG